MPLLPPPEGVHETIESLIASINTHARQEGYAIVKERSKKNKYGVLNRAYLRCDRGGKYRPRINEGTRQRNPHTRLIECPFTADARLKDEGWVLQILNPEHNHEASTSAITHPIHRRLTTELREQVAELCQAGVKPKEIAETLRQRDPNVVVLPADIYNARKQIRKEGGSVDLDPDKEVDPNQIQLTLEAIELFGELRKTDDERGRIEIKIKKMFERYQKEVAEERRAKKAKEMDLERAKEAINKLAEQLGRESAAKDIAEERVRVLGEQVAMAKQYFQHSRTLFQHSQNVFQHTQHLAQAESFFHQV